MIGLGLIGGSTLRALDAAGHRVWGATASASDAAAATADGYDVGTELVPALQRAAQEDALIVLAVPLPALDTVLPHVTEYAPNCLFTDVTSVQGPAREAVARHASLSRYVGGHPMAGTAGSGWGAGRPDLFSGAAWALTVDTETDGMAWGRVASTVLDTGAVVVPLTSVTHDEVTARISHLPHLFAATLASIGADGGPLATLLAAGSFTDATRVAATNPDLVRAMTEGNHEALLPVLDEALGRLGAARGALASTGSLAALVHTGHTDLQRMGENHSNPRTTVRIDLTASTAHEGLIHVGEQGGSITAVSEGLAVGHVPQR